MAMTGRQVLLCVFRRFFLRRGRRRIKRKDYEENIVRNIGNALGGRDAFAG